ncbi:uncharacterized protein LACBIDRAFT_331765 [Laccaria bicolor S238N-H82]|uniref:Predicted protein n=1 Tax=Laccaria bicolor (strain S238N-H82 / ATCC MYA-4686) TaxID=486041 RepID=B0DQH3_LACBS|nr:uncharacterized protein LACBIDRAFT_331765 [Laccaria bicolor S238N-H82]EDR03110.1 predicted protein [Laccaria bicolor S238N-H82]|eukprot:XP_001886251.1 predicted protein [Laccaria bicolor S238N-H82]
MHRGTWIMSLSEVGVVIGGGFYGTAIGRNSSDVREEAPCTIRPKCAQGEAPKKCKRAPYASKTFIGSVADLLGRGAQKCRKERPSEPDPVSISLIPEVHLVWKGPSHVENEDGRCVHLYLPLIPGWTHPERAHGDVIDVNGGDV